MVGTGGAKSVGVKPHGLEKPSQPEEGNALHGIGGEDGAGDEEIPDRKRKKIST